MNYPKLRVFFILKKVNKVCVGILTQFWFKFISHIQNILFACALAGYYYSPYCCSYLADSVNLLCFSQQVNWFLLRSRSTLFPPWSAGSWPLLYLSMCLFVCLKVTFNKNINKDNGHCLFLRIIFFQTCQTWLLLLCRSYLFLLSTFLSIFLSLLHIIRFLIDDSRGRWTGNQDVLGVRAVTLLTVAM